MVIKNESLTIVFLNKTLNFSFGRGLHTQRGGHDGGYMKSAWRHLLDAGAGEGFILSTLPHGKNPGRARDKKMRKHELLGALTKTLLKFV